MEDFYNTVLLHSLCIRLYFCKCISESTFERIVIRKQKIAPNLISSDFSFHVE